MTVPRGGSGEDREASLALWGLGLVFGITVVWWALALWPAPGQTPQWLELARSVCFNAGPDGLPGVSGWILLIGQPLGMFGFLAVVWPQAVARGLGTALHRPLGRLGLLGIFLISVGGLLGTGVRVARAMDAQVAPVLLPSVMTAAEHPRLDQAGAPLDLLDHRERMLTLDDLRGRPAVVTFAFGNCHDICPVVVDQARRARDAVWGPEGAAMVVVTLDPWRDTPGRLPDLAARWSLEGPSNHLLGGSVEEVERVLDGWNVARYRDPNTGDVAHPPLIYFLSADGSIAFATLSGYGIMVELGRRL